MNAFKKLLSFSALLVIIAVPFLAIANSQAIEDWWKLRNYTPSSEVQRLADVTTMTDKARRLFYVNRPEVVDSKERFRQVCTQNEQTIVLGCYHPVNEGIAIYDVPDERLNGIEEVTAAHEMLHAAYDRLQREEKDRINTLLQDYYTNDLKDTRVAKTIDAYKKFEPNDVVNEMHSIFATEIDVLPTTLEQYYRQYFNDRTRVITFSNQYEAVFTKSQEQLEGIKFQIESLKSQLDSDRNTIEKEQVYLESEY